MARNESAMAPRKKPTLRSIIFPASLAASLVFLSTEARSLSRQVPSLNTPTEIAAERQSPEIEESWIAFHLAMPERSSIREQYINQEVLAALLRNPLNQSPRLRSCDWRVQRGDVFGDFSIRVSHPNSVRRLECLRGAIDYLLRQTINESDFRSTRKNKAYYELYGWPAYIYAQPLALQKIYEKYSTLQQIHSVGSDDFSNLPFDEFDVWLQRSRERKLITFLGRGALLESLGLPVPDPMILQLVTPLKSSRVPAGVLFFDSEHHGVSALIMLSLNPGDPKRLDPQLGDRLACDTSKPSPLGARSATPAISGLFCDTSLLFGDLWLGLAVRKSESSSYENFCRQVQDLTWDADVAALVRGSLEGSKGLYVLLPQQCEPPE
ncbi:hypothetical protein [Bradyrhizobium sp. dw_411]|uniref:hypothetical protein n=1 Tax=Bradyrhizobium sp. dw_411 TaxID=2720082 RepID=UPI001BD03BE6|nr:hypothetical protein [Bradyrhizobium sp. dw_411]